MMLTGLLVFAMVVLRVFPETAAAQWLDRMVRATVAAVRQVERRHLVFLVLMTLLLTIGVEALAVMGPLDLATIVVMWDISTYIDVVVTTVVVAMATRGSIGWRALVTRFAPRRAPRARRQRSARKAAPSSNDDERPAAFARAA
ncbi:hypothetical protein [Sphingomonas sp. PAMC 26605]|uniref:hypothetical protein n=1 Tax=Sphingomonas sp. PAMC 26605 TaxID=1112214 RepID=UPI00026CDC1B|nr:hypothetical protein [Sphingomonas sp. PAMC 26605]